MAIKNIFLIFTCFLIFKPLISMAGPNEVILATQREGNPLLEAGKPYMECAMKAMGQPYRLVRGPWERAQRGTERGEYDGFLVAAKNAKRDKYAVFSEPFVNVDWIYVVKKESGISPDDADFNSRVFSANLGSARLIWLKERYEKGIIDKLESVDTSDQVLRMLMADRIDVALVNNFDFVLLLQTISFDPKDFKTHLVRRVPAATYFSKKFLSENPEFLQKYNAGIINCKKKLDQ